MRNGTRWAAFGTVAAALAVAGASLSGALTAHRAAREAALEADVLSGNIDFLEAKLAADSMNWLLSGHLADLYALRFRGEADLGDVRRAETLVRATLPLHIDRSSGLARLSSILLTQHRFAEAYDAASASIAVSQPSTGALGVFVDAARAIGDERGADSALARMDRNSFGAAVRWADRYSNRGRVDAALAHVQRACDRLDRAAALRELRAWCVTKRAAYEHLRNGPDAARAALRRALAIRPGHRGAIEMLANLAYAQQDWREARRLYERIATESHPDLYLRLAEVNRALGDDDVAATYEQRFTALASAPGAEPLNALPLALHLSETKRCDDALGIAADELTRRHSTDALEGVAWIRFNCGDVAGAAIALGEAAGMAEPSASATYLQGLLRHAGGDETAAAALITRATTDPTLLAPHVLAYMRQHGDDAS